MLLFDLNDDHRQRQADFERRRSTAETMRKAADTMTDLLDGTTEPSAEDVAVLHDPAVDPQLRSSIIDARRRMGNMNRADRYDYRDNALRPVSDAIEATIQRNGPSFAPLRRLISPGSFGDSADQWVSPAATGKLAKYDGAARNACDLNYLVDVRVPAPVRRRLLDAKRALDASSPGERHLLSKSFSGTLSREVDGLARVVGADGVAALRRVLEL
jgi:hypothetical protein